MSSKRAHCVVDLTSDSENERPFVRARREANENDSIPVDIRQERSIKYAESLLLKNSQASSSSLQERARDIIAGPKLKWQPIYIMASANISSAFNHRCLRLADLFAADDGGGSVQEVLAINYMFDLNLMLEEVSSLCDSSIPVLMLHGMKDLHQTWLHESIGNAENVQSALHKNLTCSFAKWRFAHVNINDRFGTHHTKMFLIFFEHGLRVVVHTANLLHRDIHDMTNAAWVQDFPLKSQFEREAEVGASTQTGFEATLVDYLSTYDGQLQTFPAPRHHIRSFNANVDLRRIVLKVRQYDFRAAEVTLIPSVPGRHARSVNQLDRYGHKAVRKHFDNIQKSMRASSQETATISAIASTASRLVIQVSSIGSIGKDGFYLRQLVESLLLNNTTNNASDDGGRREASAEWTTSNGIQLVFPTLECIRNGFRGYSTGNSIPVHIGDFVDNSQIKPGERCQMRPCYMKSLCKYDGSCVGRGRTPPHIKSYFQYIPVPAGAAGEASEPHLLWFLLTSSNLSQAAWGLVEGKGSAQKLYIKSYEMGVLFCPRDLPALGRSFSCTPNHATLGVDPSTIPIKHQEVRFFSSPCGASGVGEDGAVEVRFNIPYCVPPVRYSNGDVPWTVDAQTTLPDCTGMLMPH